MSSKRASVTLVTITNAERQHYLVLTAKQIASQLGNIKIEEWIIINDNNPGISFPGLFKTKLGELIGKDIPVYLWDVLGGNDITTGNILEWARGQAHGEYLIFFQDDAFYPSTRILEVVHAMEEKPGSFVANCLNGLLYDHEMNQHWYLTKMMPFGLAVSLPLVPPGITMRDVMASNNARWVAYTRPEHTGCLGITPRHFYLRSTSRETSDSPEEFMDIECKIWKGYCAFMEHAIVCHRPEDRTLVADPETIVFYFGHRNHDWRYLRYATYLEDELGKTVLVYGNGDARPSSFQGEWRDATEFPLLHVIHANLVVVGYGGFLPLRAMIGDVANKCLVCLPNTSFPVCDLQKLDGNVQVVVHSEHHRLFLKGHGINALTCSLGVPQVRELDIQFKTPYSFICCENVEHVLLRVWPYIVEAFPMARLDIYFTHHHRSLVPSITNDIFKAMRTTTGVCYRGTLFPLEEEQLKSISAWEICLEEGDLYDTTASHMDRSFQNHCIPIISPKHPLKQGRCGIHLKTTDNGCVGEIIVKIVNENRLCFFGPCETDDFVFINKPIPNSGNWFENTGAYHIPPGLLSPSKKPIRKENKKSTRRVR